MNGVLVTPRDGRKGTTGAPRAGLANPPVLPEGSAPMPPLLALYLAASALASPLLRPVLRRRAAAGKEDVTRLPERFGHPGLERPQGRLAWFHAASVGESLSLVPLIAALREARPDVTSLVTSGTVTSARLLADRLPEGAIHQYAPLDIGPAVTRFLDAWRPDLAVWVESEVWPRLILSVARRRIPALLVNARLGTRSRARWRRAPATARTLFAAFDAIQAQDEATAEVLLAVGIPEPRVAVLGSIKESAAPLPCDAGALAEFERTLAGRFVWVAASTHPGEEKVAIAAHGLLVSRDPDATLILVPRHPERGDEVAEILDQSGLAWRRRRDGPPGAVGSVYLADTLGELGLWYRLAQAAYVGGSLGGIGGHNPYEPIALGTPVLHGPDTANFADVYRALDAAGGAHVVASSAELAAALTDLGNGARAEAMAETARSVVGSGSRAFEAALVAILARLPAP